MTVSEKCAIGVALQSAEALAEFSTLSHKDFSTGLSRLVAKTMKAMYQEREPVDAVTVATKFNGKNEEVTELLAICLSEAPAPSNYKAYIQAVRTESQRRTLQNLGTTLATKANSMEYTPDQLASEAEKVFKSMANTTGIVSQEKALAEYLDGWSKQDKKGINKVYTGIQALDRLTGGIEGGKLVIIGARPAVGKSALALQTAIATAKKGTGVLYISLEMTPRELIGRTISQEGRINSTVVERYCPSEKEGKEIHQTTALVSKYPIHYMERANTPEKIRQAAMGLKKELGLIVVDYLQLMGSSERSNSRAEEVAQISRALKLLAMDLNIPIIALSQLNRESQNSQGGKLVNRRPTMAQFRESGSIEQDADIAVLLWQPEHDSGLSDGDREYFLRCVGSGMKYTVLQVEKHRGGETGDIRTGFIGKYVKFTDNIPFKEVKPVPWEEVGV